MVMLQQPVLNGESVISPDGRPLVDAFGHKIPILTYPDGHLDWLGYVKQPDFRGIVVVTSSVLVRGMNGTQVIHRDSVEHTYKVNTQVPGMDGIFPRPMRPLDDGSPDHESIRFSDVRRPGDSFKADLEDDDVVSGIMYREH